MGGEHTFSLKFRGWIDGELQTVELDHPDRWLVHTAELVDFWFDDINIKVIQKPKSLSHDKIGVGACCWDSVLLLSSYLLVRYQRHQFIGRKCVELGAGPGVVSMLLGKLQARVYATDLGRVVPVLEENRAANNLAEEAVICRELEWGSLEAKSFVESICYESYPDLVLAADCCYSDGDCMITDVGDFVSTLRSLCGPNTTVFLAQEIRSMEIYQQLVRMLQQNFRNMKKVSLLKLPEGLQDKNCDIWELSKPVDCVT